MRHARGSQPVPRLADFNLPPGDARLRGQGGMGDPRPSFGRVPVDGGSDLVQVPGGVPRFQSGKALPVEAGASTSR